MVPECVAGYSAFLHGVDNAVHYLALYPFMRETVKWPKKEETGILGLHENYSWILPLLPHHQLA
jgi:hypothetical protein